MIESFTCPWVAPQYFIYSSDAPALLYYAYIPILLVSLLFGVFVFIKDRQSLQGKIFLAICIFFSMWVMNILVQWAVIIPSVQVFSAQLNALLELPIFILTSYFSYVFIKDKDLIFGHKVLLVCFYLPVILFLPSSLNIASITSDCTANLGPLWFYVFGIESLSILSIFLLGFREALKNSEHKARYHLSFFITGVTLFLGVFLTTNILPEVINTYDAYQINLVGPLGMLTFLGFLSYMIVKFKIFNIKLLATQALVFVSGFLIASQFFFIRTNINRVLNGLTFIIFCVVGVFLVRSVKKEVQSREKIEELADSLVKSNDKLESANIKLKELDKLKSEFLSLASHQIRNPLTAIKGYASLVLDGTYGEVSQSVREAVERMYQSTQSLVVIVSDFLDISRIEQGTMKYDFTSFDIHKLAVQVVEEFRPNILKAGLTISSVAGPGDYFVNADQGKIKQVIGNLIDNAIKYTPTGSIKVALSRHSLSDGTSGRVRVTVSDTGVGIDQAVIPQLFAKFTRDKDAFKTNVSGTGLGLYLAKQMIQAHHGKIWAESDGRGKGSRFIIELDTIR